MNVQDRRRLLGPPNAKPIVFSNSDANPTKAALASPKVALLTDIIPNCNGSSSIEIDDNVHRQASIITSVYGPRAVKGLFTFQSALSIQFKTGSEYSSSNLKEIAEHLIGIFQSVVNTRKYPKSGIDIFIYIVYDKNVGIDNLIPYFVMGVTMALVDAGIEIFDLAAAGFYRDSIVTFSKNGTKVVGYWKDDGDFEEDSFDEAIAQCKIQYHQHKNLMVQHFLEKHK